MAETMLGSIITLMLVVLTRAFGGATWASWVVLLKAAFALPLSASELETFTKLTGRTRPPAKQVRAAWFLMGRRSGKSIIAALIAVYATCCCTYVLAPGEVGVFIVVAADRKQARVIKRYISGLLNAASPLKAFIAHETADAIYLTNGLCLEVHTASFRSLRGYTCIGFVADEIAFWRDEGSANPDAEILNALWPAMATVSNAMGICISSLYRKTGEAYRAFRDHFGKDEDDVLVAMADTRTMNPNVPQRLIDDAFAKDPARAASEYGRDGVIQFRADIDSFIDEAVIAACTGDRAELPPVAGISYRAGFDGAGGGVGADGDSETFAIAHDEADGRTVLDLVREIQPPFNPEQGVAEFAKLCHAYGVSSVTGDRYAGTWPQHAFAKHGIHYEPCKQSKSDLYKALLPRLNSGSVELRDVPKLRQQLLGLERRTGFGGRDQIDHAPGGHDDVVNAAAIVLASGEGAELPLALVGGNYYRELTAAQQRSALTEPEVTLRRLLKEFAAAMDAQDDERCDALSEEIDRHVEATEREDAAIGTRCRALVEKVEAALAQACEEVH